MRSSLGDLGAAQIIKLLNLRPHPEGGWYGETFRAEAVDDRRPSSTAIYYLLEADQVSAWHRVDADEAWHHYAGAPLVLTLSPPDGVGAKSLHLGSDLMAGQRPQAVVPAARLAWSAVRLRQVLILQALSWPRQTGGQRSSGQSPWRPWLRTGDRPPHLRGQ
jgi:predicted cupin superfamily sugar epimerase